MLSTVDHVADSCNLNTMQKCRLALHVHSYDGVLVTDDILQVWGTP